MNCLYTIPLCNFGFAFRHATCVIVKDFGKALLKTKSSPIFFSYKLSERKPLFEIANCPVSNNSFGLIWFSMGLVGHGFIYCLPSESFVVSFVVSINVVTKIIKYFVIVH